MDLKLSNSYVGEAREFFLHFIRENRRFLRQRGEFVGIRVLFLLGLTYFYFMLTT